MPSPKAGFSVKEQKFIEVFIATMDKDKAIKAAGYTKQGAWAALQREDVRAALNAHSLAQMQEGRQLAQRNVISELRKKDCNPRFSLEALKFFEDRLSDQDPGREKDLHDLTLAEIRHAAAEAQKQLAALEDVTPAETLELTARDVTPGGDVFG